MEKLPIENLKPVTLLAIEFANVADQMQHVPEGQSKLAPLMNLSDELFSLGAIKFDQVIPEFKDLDEAERAELLSAVKAKFDLADDKLEGAIEEGLGIAGDLFSLIKRGVKLAESMKA